MSQSVAPAPAYHIPLSDSELRLVGEIAAIQGQIEYLLGHAMQVMLDISTEAMLAMMHSPSLKTNTYTFVTVARTKAPTDELRDLAEHVFTQMEILAKGRNDFIHAIYATDTPDGAGFALSSGIGSAIDDAVAIKTGSYKKRRAAELQEVRDGLAKISCALAHFEHCTIAAKGADPAGSLAAFPSPWHGRF
jgi:hypothetical protein